MTKQLKPVKSIINSQIVNMGGIKIDQPLPNSRMDQVDPFLLIHHWKDELPGEQDERNLGVGPHPHRGFSPVTFIFKGAVHHRDSLGNSSIVKAGGTQWINAGRGITHSERPDKKLAENGGEFEIIQFWLNQPADKKMTPAKYTSLQKEDVPVFRSKDNLTEVQVISGKLFDIEGAVKHPSPTLILRMNFSESGELVFKVPESFNSVLYVLEGEVNIQESVILKDNQLAHFGTEGTTIEMKAKKNTTAIFLSGQPLDEPVTSYGPFVMNNQTQIMEAMRDAQMGKMGILIEEF